MSGNAEGNRMHGIDGSIGQAIPFKQQDMGHRNQGRSGFDDETGEDDPVGVAR
jgi:hypothetical protein